jgi:predicted nucleic acid-binding protein
MTEAKAAQRLYLDANVFIYAIEGEPRLADPIRDFFEALHQSGNRAVTSELTLAEVLPKAHEVHRRSYFNLIVWSQIVDLQPVSRDILIETADYRRMAGMPKLPDAIHVVTAVRSNCRTILSADDGLKLPEGYAMVAPTPDNLSRIARELS